MKVEAVQTTKAQRVLSSEAAPKKSAAQPIAFAAKRGGARRLFVAHGDIIRGTVASGSPTPRAIMRVISDCN